MNKLFTVFFFKSITSDTYPKIYMVKICKRTVYIHNVYFPSIINFLSFLNDFNFGILGFIKIAFDNCTTFNTTLEWNTQPDEKTFCVLEQNRCFNWSCSCKDKNNVSSSLTTGDTTYKCSGHISSSDNTTAKQSYREASINQSGNFFSKSKFILSVLIGT